MKYMLFGLAVLLSSAAFSQKNTYKGFPSLIWPKLYDIQFVKAKDQHGEYDKPVFSDPVKALNGKRITLPGYIVPFENGLKKSSKLMLSSLPLNACFFCGVGGPESVVEVYLTSEIAYTDKPVEIEGVLRINDKDPDKMIYVLEKAEVIGEVGF